jgi:hypothetical protein
LALLLMMPILAIMIVVVTTAIGRHRLSEGLCSENIQVG